jgi:hypothetical protein
MTTVKQTRISGQCRLTGHHGSYVGWYDNELVTRVGEDILEQIDTPAIQVLREHRLIWSSWASDETLITNDLLAPSGEQAYREIRIPRAKELQLFFLSVLWRSAATSRHEFSEVQLAADTLEDIRIRVCCKNPGAFSDYPVQLFQTTSKGVLHNRVPLLESNVFELEDGDSIELEYLRIYFDGLVARVHTKFDERLLGTCLRSDEPTTVRAYAFDNSRNASDIKEVVSTVVKESMTPNSPLTAIAGAVRNEWRT